MSKKSNSIPDTIWLCFENIKEEYPEYKGEWPISYWCYKNYTESKANAKIYVTKEGYKDWYCFVPEMKAQVDWYIRYSNVEKRRRRRAGEASGCV